MLIVDITISKN